MSKDIQSIKNHQRVEQAQPGVVWEFFVEWDLDFTGWRSRIQTEDNHSG